MEIRTQVLIGFVFFYFEFIIKLLFFEFNIYNTTRGLSFYGNLFVSSKTARIFELIIVLFFFCLFHLNLIGLFCESYQMTWKMNNINLFFHLWNLELSSNDFCKIILFLFEKKKPKFQILKNWTSWIQYQSKFYVNEKKNTIKNQSTSFFLIQTLFVSVKKFAFIQFCFNYLNSILISTLHVSPFLSFSLSLSLS